MPLERCYFNSRCISLKSTVGSKKRPAKKHFVKDSGSGVLWLFMR